MSSIIVGRRLRVTMNKIVLIAVLVILSLHTHAIALQKDETEEKPVEVLKESSNRNFAEWLFSGAFTKKGFTGINPNYRITQGDTLLVQLWGGVDVQQEINVDAQGNVFIPKVGPVKVKGVKNSELNKVVLKSIKRVYKSNVQAYVTLISSQTVKVYLAGMVNSPGLYEGYSADSVLSFIDQAGGIRRKLGSYRFIEIKRNNKTVNKIDLYDFVQNGSISATQLQDGDVILVKPKVGEISLEGELGFTGQYEVTSSNNSLKEILSSVAISENATHVTVVSPSDKKGLKEVSAKQYSLGEIENIEVPAGSKVRVSTQMRANSISVEVVGEHKSQFEMVLPWGATLHDLLAKVEYSNLSNKKAIQLYRQSVAKRQKDMLLASLSSLEQSVLTARSATKEAAQLRAAEAETILKWIEKAKSVEPKGQVLLADNYRPHEIILKQGDRVVIPAKQNLVMVHGEVLFPTAITFGMEESIENYINKAGGTMADLDDMNILVMKPNGSFVDVNSDLEDKDEIEPGDEIFVLAKPEVKSLQLAKDITQVIYQVAVSAAVVLAL
jgi:protein involved in polysaccharide export with SLBB domain